MSGPFDAGNLGSDIAPGGGMPGQISNPSKSNLHDHPDKSQESSRGKASARDVLATLSSRRIDIDDIKFIGERVIDKGGMGSVAVATIISDERSRSKSGRTVAVKKLHTSDGIDEEKFLRGFVNELRVVEGLSHPHIVKIIGFVEDMEKRVAWLIIPWEANGNVREFLRSGRWELPERVSLIQDVSSGLDYLHTHQPPICHGDLKSLNILVNSEHRAVITDFGSARVLRREPELPVDPPSNKVAPADHDAPVLNHPAAVALSVSDSELTLTGPSWSLRWAAPEVLNDEQPDLASDIWALGWIAWELITDNYPFPETKSQSIITIKVIKGQLPSIYKDDQLSQVHQLCDVMVRCWKAEPKERPSAADCRRALQWIPFIVPSPSHEKVRSAALFMQIGEMHRLQDRYEEASRALEDGLAIAQVTGDKRTIAGIVLRLGEIHRAQSRIVEAEASYTTALEIFTSIGNNPGRATALLTLGEIHWVRSKYAEAMASCTEALDIFTNIGDDWGQATVLLTLGDIRRVQSKDAKALECYTGALGIFTNIGNAIGRANALLGLADIYREQMDHTRAGDFYAQSLEIHASIGNEAGRATALRGIGDIHQARSEYTEAEACYTQALRIHTSMGSDLGRGNTLNQLGDLHQTRLEYIEAEDSYNQSLEIFRKIEDKWGQANALVGLGNAHKSQSRYSDAEKSCTQALALYAALGNDVGRTNSLLRLSEIRLHQARFAEAKVLIHDAVQISETLDHLYSKYESKRILQLVLEAEKGSAKTEFPTSTPLGSTTATSATASCPLLPTAPCPKLALLSSMTH